MAAQRELYVYYRVASADAEVVAVQVRALQAALCASHPGLQARLLRRPVLQADVQTWMEVYARAGGVDEALVRTIESAAAALRPPLPTPRHCEVFEAFSSD